MKRRNLWERLLDHDVAIILAFVFILALGAFSLFTIDVAFLPRHREPVLTILTDYYGMEPRAIEEIITRPLEGILKEIEGVTSFHSFSQKGKSKILVFLDRREDANRKAVLVKDRIFSIADSFPEEAHEPAVYTYNTDDSPVMIIALSPASRSDGEGDRFGEGSGAGAFSDRTAVVELGALAEQRVKPELLSVEGIANVEIAGAGRDDYFIELDYENIARLAGERFVGGRKEGGSPWGGFEELFTSIAEGNVSIPLGNLKGEHGLLPVSFPNKYRDLSILPRYPFRLGGELVPGSTLFSVSRRKREDETFSLVHNDPSVTLYVYRRDFANILQIENQVRAVLRRWTGTFSARVIYNQAGVFRDLLKQLFIGALAASFCVFVLVLFFYRRLTLAWLVFVTIPLCAGCTLALLALFGRSVNVMSLAGLIVGIGTCVDNTIVAVEYMLFSGRVRDCLARSMAKIHRPVLSSTITTVIVFIPLSFIGGLSLYTDFALSISAMLLSSYAVSILFVPTFVKRFVGARVPGLFAGRGTAYNTPSGRMRLRRDGTLGGFFLWVARSSFRRPAQVLAAFFAVSGAFTYLFIRLEPEDVPPLKENEFELSYEFDPVYTGAYKEGVVSELGGEILAFGFLMELVSKLEDTKATFFLKFPPGDRRFGSEVRALKEHFSNMSREDGFFYFEKGAETGISSVTLNFFGDDLEKLNGLVDTAASGIAGLNGVRQVLKGYKKGKPEIELALDPALMYYHGLNPAEIIRFLRYVFYHPVIMKHYEENGVVDVRGKITVEQLTKENLDPMESIGSLRVPGAKGAFVALRDLGVIRHAEGPGVISRKNGKRYISLDVRYEGMRERAMVEQVRASLKGVRFEKDLFFEFDEELLEKKRSSLSFLLSLGLAVFLVYTVIGIVTRSFSAPLITLCAVPALFVGSFLYLRLSGASRSPAAHVALILLVGLSMNSLILLMGEIRTGAGGRRRAGHDGGGVVRGERALLGAYRRSGRVLVLTMLTTVVSLVPVYLLATATHFFKIVTGVISLGLVVGIPLSLGVFPALYRLMIQRGEVFNDEQNDE